MSTTADRLDMAAFPGDYADILVETLGITAANYPGVKDALDRYRRLDDDAAALVMRRIAEHEDIPEGAISPDDPPPVDPVPYFRGPSGTRYAYAAIADRIRKEAPHTLGQHIFVQLEAIGLLDELQDGTTPCGLPYTFAGDDETPPANHAVRRVGKLHYAVRHDDGTEESLYWEVAGAVRPYEDAVNELLDFYRSVARERVIFVEALK